MQSTVLVTDEDPHTVLLIKLAVQTTSLPVDFRSVTRRGDYVASLSQPSPDVLITELSLPWGNGFGVAGRYRQAGFSCPIIMLTAVGDEEVAVNAIKRGFHDYIYFASDWERLLPRAIESAIQGLPSPFS
ncbi:hypothetical protein GCM10011390_20720 [Aureimonas endophytica]|uniref:Response regulatory domain-containing protein n=1 Tax=Aureimonas endophytica TaxID=2027858 RepID=A0A916ZJW9_9HYPH|nr:response regulator [Aureimonas endophytica]GGE01681.1 hypothetical protein GCM10011390_20720 [Aureimonas endophytica]